MLCCAEETNQYRLLRLGKTCQWSALLSCICDLNLQRQRPPQRKANVPRDEHDTIHPVACVMPSPRCVQRLLLHVIDTP